MKLIHIIDDGTLELDNPDLLPEFMLKLDDRNAGYDIDVAELYKNVRDCNSDYTRRQEFALDYPRRLPTMRLWDEHY